MKLSRSFRFLKPRRVYRLNQRARRSNVFLPTIAIGVSLLCGGAVMMLDGAYSPHGTEHPISSFVSNKLLHPLKPSTNLTPVERQNRHGATKSSDTTATLKTLTATSPMQHTNITTTIFWAGEAADSANAYISNEPSAWDEHWATHYGGYDDPDHRMGFFPAKFTPKENPFYFALPYNDLDAKGKRKASAKNCLPYTPLRNDQYSYCKNVWIAIVHGNSVAYAQWQDVGPMEEDDAAYVFGNATPKNTFNSHAGLDVSPAVRDYLHLEDIDHTSWSFVTADQVPNGPWKQRVTSSLGYQIY